MIGIIVNGNTSTDGGESRAMRRFAFRFVCVFLGLLLLAAAGQKRIEAQERAVDRALRIWSTRAGDYQTKATLLAFDGKVVQLRKENGARVSIAIEKLSEADQEYVRKQIGGYRKTKDSVPRKADTGATSEVESKCRDLCEQITKAYGGKGAGGKATIAVVEFSSLSGGVTDFGRLLSEELITRLFSTGNYKVIERLLLNKAIADHKLKLQGLIDPKSAKELGKILGVDAIVSGTIADLGDSLRVNARLISTETGEILSVAATSMRKDKLPPVGRGQPFESGGNASATAPRGNAKLPFREDFSGYKDGETATGGPAAKVVTGADGRKWLAPVGKGQKPIGLNVRLPDNAYIEFDYNAGQLESKRDRPSVLSGINLVDEAGTKYRIEWTISDIDPGVTGGGKYTLKLPGGASTYGYAAAGTIRIRKAGDTITVAREGDHELTANVSDFKNFTRFEVDIYKGPNSMIKFTNFKIGSTGGGIGRTK